MSFHSGQILPAHCWPDEIRAKQSPLCRNSCVPHQGKETHSLQYMCSECVTFLWNHISVHSQRQYITDSESAAKELWMNIWICKSLGKRNCGNILHYSLHVTYIKSWCHFILGVCWYPEQQHSFSQVITRYLCKFTATWTLSDGWLWDNW